MITFREIEGVGEAAGIQWMPEIADDPLNLQSSLQAHLLICCPQLAVLPGKAVAHLGDRPSYVTRGGQKKVICYTNPWLWYLR